MKKLTPYQKRMVKRDKKSIKMADKVFIGDLSTYIENTGNGTYDIISPKSVISVDSDGNINISGSTSVKIGGNFDFTQLPDRFIRPSGISWNKVTAYSKIIGVIPTNIRGQKVFIPFLDINPP